MTYIILTQPHPLDAIWTLAVEAVHKARVAVDAQPPDFTDEDNNALCSVLIDAIAVVIALPARHVEDSLYKLDMSGLGADGPLSDFDHDAILQEGLSLIDAAIARGAKIKALNPEFLEGVTL